MQARMRIDGNEYEIADDVRSSLDELRAELHRRVFRRDVGYMRCTCVGLTAGS